MRQTSLMIFGCCIVVVLSASCSHRTLASAAPTLPPPPQAIALEARTIRAVLREPVNTGPSLPNPRAEGSCRSKEDLQDSACTPGVASALVTQANIKTTICKSGYTKKIRTQYAPVSYTNALKTQQISEYGYTDTKLADYEEDHLISLELGGHPNDPRNLWPEFPHSPNPKDSVEGKLKRLVCAGKVPLDDAQLAIATNWKTALQSVQSQH